MSGLQFIRNCPNSCGLGQELDFYPLLNKTIIDQALKSKARYLVKTLILKFHYVVLKRVDDVKTLRIAEMYVSKAIE